MSKLFWRRDEDSNWSEQQCRMVREQLQRRGIVDSRLLAAMEEVPRHEFVDRELWSSAYDDGPLPIGYGQTISQPYTVAFMLELLRLEPTDVVLEIGCGCGYSAGIMSRLVRQVYTIDRVPQLVQMAQRNLASLQYQNVQVLQADGTLGLEEQSPFDAIVVAAAGTSLPDPLANQLAVGGRCVIPLGRTKSRQMMYRFTKLKDQLLEEEFGAFAFVPLIGRHSWPE